MKKSILLLLVACSFKLAAFSQSDKYEAAMKSNLALFDSSKTSADFIALANNFERIGDAEKAQWLPYYYAGLALSSAGWVQGTTIDKDANSDRTNALMDKAEALVATDTDKSEIYAIRNMAYTQQMLIDPQSRWMSYGQKAGAALQKGLQLNPNNPRLYYLQGMSLIGTPVQYGGGKDKAKPVFEKAVELYKTANPAHLHPKWGQKEAENMLAQCEKP